MSDTPAKVAAIVMERHRQMTPDERVEIAARMFDDARAIVESSLPASCTGRERRLALVRRLYGSALPRAALVAFADWSTED